MEPAKIEIEVLAMAVGVLVLVEITAVRLIPAIIPDLTRLGLVRLVETGLLVAVIHFRGPGLAALGLGRRSWLPGLKKGLLASAACGVLTASGFLALWLAGDNPLRFFRSPVPEGVSEVLRYLAVGAVVGPLAEEVFFRGIVYGFFRRWGVLPAVALSTLVFVLAHPGVPGIPVTQVVGGLLFAGAYEWSRSLVTPVVIHVLGNTAMFGVAVAARHMMV